MRSFILRWTNPNNIIVKLTDGEFPCCFIRYACQFAKLFTYKWNQLFAHVNDNKDEKLEEKKPDNLPNNFFVGKLSRVVISEKNLYARISNEWMYAIESNLYIILG